MGGNGPQVGALASRSGCLWDQVMISQTVGEQTPSTEEGESEKGGGTVALALGTDALPLCGGQGARADQGCLCRALGPRVPGAPTTS